MNMDIRHEQVGFADQFLLKLSSPTFNNQTLTGSQIVDIINERTLNEGVTIDGVLLKDGLINGVDISDKVNKSGDTMDSNASLSFQGGGQVTGLPTTPIGATSATSKAYVDAVAVGARVKANCRVATTGNVSIASAPADIDGITLNSGDRVLVKSQTDAKENGIYIFNGAASAMTRSIDMDNGPAGEIFNGVLVSRINEGMVNIISSFVIVSIGTGTGGVHTIGVDDIDWDFFVSPTSLVDGNGIDISGNIINTAINSTNLKFTATEINTIQDIDPTAVPSFSGLTLGTEALIGTNAALKLQSLGDGNYVSWGTTRYTGVFAGGDLFQGYNCQYNETTGGYFYENNEAVIISEWARVGDFKIRTAPTGTAGTPYTPTDRFIVKNNGNVGIGSDTVPRTKLEIKGTSGAETGLGSQLVTIRDNRTTVGSAVNYVSAITRQNSDTEALYFGNNNNNDSFIVANDADMVFGKDVSGTFTEIMRMKDDGNLLVSSAAVTALGRVSGVVNGTENIAGGFFRNLSSTNTLPALSVSQLVSTNLVPAANFSSNANTQTVNISNSHVGLPIVLNLSGDGGMSVNSTKVIGVQGPPILDADGTLGDATSTINEILAVIRGTTGHGLIP